MEKPPLEANDPARWGHSLANAAALVLACLEAREPRSVIEIGSDAGDLTEDLLDWAADRGASVTAVDPAPTERLEELASRRPELRLVRRTSHEALRELAGADAAIIDGDHNYFTVRGELELIAEGAPEGRLPLILLHDVGWPHGRRDTYYVPERIPEEHRQPMVEGGGLVPGETGIVPGGLPYRSAAKREGGDRNGVLTAVEDFLDGREGVRFALIPVFFGIGVIWPLEAEWSDAVARVLEPFDRNPVLGHLEENRVFQLAQVYLRRGEIHQLSELLSAHEQLLGELRSSGAFRAADRASRLRNRGRAESWSDRIERLLARGAELRERGEEPY